MRGQDIFVHMASTLFGTTWRDYLQTNARAAQNIAAVYQGLPARERPKQVIFVSSLAAAGPCASAPGLSEDCQPAPVSAYGWSKLLCERTLQASIGNNLAILRPPIIYGSNDRALLPMFRSARLGWGVSPGWKRDFPISLLHADDAARAIILAAQTSASGVFHLSDGQIHTMETFCQAMGKVQGRERVRVLHLPLPLMGTSAALASASAALYARVMKGLGANPGTPQWNIDKYRESRECGWLASSAKISEQLGFAASRPLEAGVAEAVTGYRAAGWLR